MRAVFPANNLSHQTEFSRYLKANPGKKTRSMNPFVYAGNPPHQTG